MQTTTHSCSRAGGHQSLGKIAKSINPGAVRSPKATRFELRNCARRATKDVWSDKPLGEDGQGRRRAYRTFYCGRSMRGNYVNVYRAADGSRARFTGLVTCGSGWLCPVCCMAIAEARRRELSAGLVWWVTTGGQAQLLTLTAPHSADMALADLWARFDKARSAFNNSRAFKRIRAEAKRAGQVCSAETTFGINGWHPHLHVIYFCRVELTKQQVFELQSEWVKQLLKAGLGDTSKLSDMLAHALDVRGGKDAAAYITKYGREETWGISSELTRQHTKEGRGEHVTPFGLLALMDAGELAPGGRDPAALFREFAAVSLDKRLMTWSPGLRAALQLGQELTDVQLTEQPMPDETSVGRLDAEQWKIVATHHAEAELLDYVSSMCVDIDTGQRDLDDFVAYLGRRR